MPPCSVSGLGCCMSEVMPTSLDDADSAFHARGGAVEASFLLLDENQFVLTLEYPSYWDNTVVKVRLPRAIRLHHLPQAILHRRRRHMRDIRRHFHRRRHHMRDIRRHFHRRRHHMRDIHRHFRRRRRRHLLDSRMMIAVAVVPFLKDGQYSH
ncbi:hypothetical protein CDL15_Pgr009900 [Punica granatum]|uniref:Uncharacterized protein n=1 Tax=Punica granatum TaxID=22663 RepID=A0A218WTS5_PUNGR|nr:hypothetical protein CDL15_Pgr009900 [Punica granatum]